MYDATRGHMQSEFSEVINRLDNHFPKESPACQRGEFVHLVNSLRVRSVDRKLAMLS